MIAQVLFDDLSGEQFSGDYISVVAIYRNIDNPYAMSPESLPSLQFLSMDNAVEYIAGKLERTKQDANGDTWRLSKIEFKDGHAPELVSPLRFPDQQI